jgi:hypothetical protein
LPSPPVEGIPLNWLAPSGYVKVANLEEAREHLPFDPNPGAIGEPDSWFVSDSALPLDERGLILLFSDTSGEPFWVIESSSPMQQEDLVHRALDCVPEVGCSSKNTMITIRGDVQALLVEGKVENSVTWLAEGLVFYVLGPATTFSSDEAIQTADSF